MEKKKGIDYNLRPEPTEIENVPPKIFSGLLVLIAGVIVIFPLSILGFFMFVIPGIGLLFLGVAIAMQGILMMTKRIKVECPYCGKTKVVSKRMTASKCPSCKKTGVIKEGYMNPID
jgi:endogenous inhibitor of DNA gyrase (YacG/DUF329 family)